MHALTNASAGEINTISFSLHILVSSWLSCLSPTLASISISILIRFLYWS